MYALRGIGYTNVYTNIRPHTHFSPIPGTSDTTHYWVGQRANSLILLKNLIKGGDPKSSVHTFRMLVFQVLCSLKPGEASMAYSLRSDMKCCIKHQVKERELDIPISSDDQFKEAVSVNTKTKQNTHLFESQSGIHCFKVFFIFSFQNISPLIKLF